MKKIILAVVCLAITGIFSSISFSAEKVAIAVKTSNVKASDEAMKVIAYNSAANFFKKKGFEVTENSTEATKTVEINVEDTWSHRVISPYLLLIGGIQDLFLFDCGHARIQVVVKDSSGKEIFNGNEMGTSCDLPIISFLKNGRKHEKIALSKAIGSALKKAQGY